MLLSVHFHFNDADSRSAKHLTLGPVGHLQECDGPGQTGFLSSTSISERKHSRAARSRQTLKHRLIALIRAYRLMPLGDRWIVRPLWAVAGGSRGASGDVREKDIGASLVTGMVRSVPVTVLAEAAALAAPLTGWTRWPETVEVGVCGS